MIDKNHSLLYSNRHHRQSGVLIIEIIPSFFGFFITFVVNNFITKTNLNLYE